MVDLQLDTPQAYIDLYKNIGVEQMVNWFHLFDNIGTMCRVNHPSVAYFKSINRVNDIYCERCNQSHRSILESSGYKEVVSICPYDHTTKVHPRYYDKAVIGNFVQPDSNSIFYDIHKSRMIHFLQYLWDEDVLVFREKHNMRTGMQGLSLEQKEKYIKAFIPVLEVDANDDASGNRRDMFEADVFQDFVAMDGYIRDRFKDTFGSFRKFSSGGGVYYVGKPIRVSSVEELHEVKNDFYYGWCKKIKYYFIDNSSKTWLCHIDADFQAWNSYYKAPFTLHRKFDRCVIPIPAMEDLDADYIRKYGNPLILNPEVCKMLWDKGKM